MEFDARQGHCRGRIWNGGSLFVQLDIHLRRAPGYQFLKTIISLLKTRLALAAEFRVIDIALCLQPSWSEACATASLTRMMQRVSGGFINVQNVSTLHSLRSAWGVVGNASALWRDVRKRPSTTVDQSEI